MSVPRFSKDAQFWSMPWSSILCIARVGVVSGGDWGVGKKAKECTVELTLGISEDKLGREKMGGFTDGF